MSETRPLAKLDYTDFERQTNETLSDPEGRNLADTIANAVLAWSAKYCNRLTWDYGTQTEYFSPDCGQDLYYVSTLPLDTAQAVTVSTCNPSTDGYDAYTGTVRKRDNGAVKVGDYLSSGYEAVKIAYTGGYADNDFPLDLKQALTELLVQKFNDAQSGGKVLAEVKAIDYSEKYDLNAADIPGDILEVLEGYKLPVVY